MSAARIGISGWATILLFHLLFLLALWILDDPGEDWPPFVWISPLACLFVTSVATTGVERLWSFWLIAYVLVAAVTWITTGPWTNFMTWCCPMLAAITPAMLWRSIGAGAVAQRWLPELLLK